MSQEPDDVFLLSVATIVAGLAGLVVRYFFKSKCTEFTCCYGLIKVERDSRAENDMETRQLELGATEPSSPTTLNRV
jgi:hypothetical protein